MTALKLLQRARERVMLGWTKGWFARDKYNQCVNICSIEACSFCLSGSLYHKDSFPKEEVEAKYYLTANLPRGHVSIVSFNDDPMTTKDMVIGLIDTAIEAAERVNQ